MGNRDSPATCLESGTSLNHGGRVHNLLYSGILQDSKARAMRMTPPSLTTNSEWTLTPLNHIFSSSDLLLLLISRKCLRPFHSTSWKLRYMRSSSEGVYPFIHWIRHLLNFFISFITSLDCITLIFLVCIFFSNFFFVFFAPFPLCRFA